MRINLHASTTNMLMHANICACICVNVRAYNVYILETDKQR